MINIIVNNVIEFFQGEEEKSALERVLWISLDGENLITFSLDKKDALPVPRTRAEVVKALEEGIAKVSNALIDHLVYSSEEQIPQKHKEIRDFRWRVISEMVASEPHIYDSEYRGQMVRKIMEKFNCSKPAVYKYLRAFWRNGKTKNALLPRYDKCGGPGNERNASSKKRGRPKNISRWNSDLIGINVDSKTKNLLLKGIRLFYLNNSRITLKQAYQKTIEVFFNIGYRYEGEVRIPIIPDPNELPTFGQFYYYYKKEQDIKQTLESRYGTKSFNLKKREVLGSSTAEAFGPGSIYQIDATIGDVYLVNRYERSRIIGRPVIYTLIDVFSRMVAGVYVGLEGPSWMGAMMALENATTNKVAFCEQYGIKIDASIWPCQHLPESIGADRGEMVGNKPENLINSLGVVVKNMPPYRADWKGIVEQYFRISNLKFINWLPGAVRERERGDHDYRLDAVLDIVEFTELTIRCILHYNTGRLMEWYPLSKEMIRDGVAPYPSELWRWGVKNRSGHLRQHPEDIIKLNLMPVGEATVTREGILFKGMHYVCERALKENWFVMAGKKTWKVSICFDPRCVDFLYIRDSGGRHYEKCRLLSHETRYAGMRLEEVLDEAAVSKLRANLEQGRGIQSKAELDAHIEAVCRRASKKAKESLTPKISKSERIDGIRSNRKQERESIRGQEAWELGNSESASNGDKGVIKPFPTTLDSSNDCAKLNKISMLRRLREEAFNDGDK